LSVSVSAEVVISNGVLQASSGEQHLPGKCQVIYMSQGALGDGRKNPSAGWGPTLIWFD